MSTKILTIYHKEMDPKKRKQVAQKSSQQIVEAGRLDEEDNNKKDEEYMGIDQQHLLEYEDPESAKGAKGFEFSVHLKGMGISIIDN